MTDRLDLWEVRQLPGGIALELYGRAAPVLILVQGESSVRIGLTHVKTLVAALTDAAAHLTEVLPSGGVHHA